MTKKQNKDNSIHVIDLKKQTIKPMDNYLATGIAEGFEEAENEEEYIKAWQHLIDTKLAWQLQGRFGRIAERLIEQKICHC